MNIVELMDVPTEEHGEDWLKDALQNAVKLELATIPPYLLALWSVKNDTSEGKYIIKSIKEIVFEEMTHLGLVCNMLTTIGVTPDIFPGAFPKYPSELPGGVKPGLQIPLRKLSPEQLEIFKAIEAPEHTFDPPLIELELALDVNPLDTFPTIGKFYDAIEAAFQNHSDLIKGERQLTMDFPNISVFELKTLADVEKAILQIKDEGEGTSQTDPADGDNPAGVDLAHFYRFREITDGHKLIKNAAGEWIKDPAELKFPGVLNIADVPDNGFPESAAFDKLYTTLIKTLHSAWANNSQNDLDDASFNQMGDLTTAVKTLMATPIPNDPKGQTFAPSFLLIE